MKPPEGSPEPNEVGDRCSTGAVQLVSPRSTVFLFSLFFLPGFLLIVWKSFFNGTGIGDRYDWASFYIFLIINAPCSFGAAYGMARLYSVGFKKMLIAVVVGLVFYGVSLFGSLIIAYFLFAPRC